MQTFEDYLPIPAETMALAMTSAVLTGYLTGKIFLTCIHGLEEPRKKKPHPESTALTHEQGRAALEFASTLYYLTRPFVAGIIEPGARGMRSSEVLWEQRRNHHTSAVCRTITNYLRDHHSDADIEGIEALIQSISCSTVKLHLWGTFARVLYKQGRYEECRTVCKHFTHTALNHTIIIRRAKKDYDEDFDKICTDICEALTLLPPCLSEENVADLTKLFIELHSDIKEESNRMAVPAGLYSLQRRGYQLSDEAEELINNGQISYTAINRETAFYLLYQIQNNLKGKLPSLEIFVRDFSLSLYYPQIRKTFVTLALADKEFLKHLKPGNCVPKNSSPILVEEEGRVILKCSEGHFLIDDWMVDDYIRLTHRLILACLQRSETLDLKKAIEDYATLHDLSHLNMETEQFVLEELPWEIRLMALNTLTTYGYVPKYHLVSSETLKHYTVVVMKDAQSKANKWRIRAKQSDAPPRTIHCLKKSLQYRADQKPLKEQLRLLQTV